MARDPRRISRRGLLALGAAWPVAWKLGAAGAVLLRLTPEAADADEVATPATVEGPYFRPRSPETRALRGEKTEGTPFTLTGRVLSTKGAPIPKALLDVWQADSAGAYDLAAFRMRGHQFTGDDGSFRLETVVPGYYPGRTRHIHLKVQAPGGPVLTTQLFFPNEPRNRSDGIYSTWLRMRVDDLAGGGRRGAFDFVVRTA